MSPLTSQNGTSIGKRSYRFKEPVQTNAGDEIRITCTWDNSAGNQPIVDGQPLEPRNITWGDSTFDEMCLGGVTSDGLKSYVIQTYLILRAPPLGLFFLSTSKFAQV